jgi:hypothetical protein
MIYRKMLKDLNLNKIDFQLLNSLRLIRLFKEGKI